MVFREVSVIEVREVLRAWLAGKSERAVAAQAGVDLKTGRRYVEAAVAAGLSRGGGRSSSPMSCSGGSCRWSGRYARTGTPGVGRAGGLP